MAIAAVFYVGATVALTASTRARLDAIERTLAAVRTTPHVPATVRVTPESAADRACRRADDAVRAGHRGGPLCGL